MNALKEEQIKKIIDSLPSADEILNSKLTQGEIVKVKLELIRKTQEVDKELIDFLENKIEELQSKIKEHEIRLAEEKSHADSVIEGLNNKIREMEKQLEIAFSCPDCKIPMKHLKEIHTFECPKCGYREWYPQRYGDQKDLMNVVSKEIRKTIDKIELKAAKQKIQYRSDER